MTARLTREPGDDSVWDSNDPSTWDDAIALECKEKGISLESLIAAEQRRTKENVRAVADAILPDSTCRPWQSQSPLEERMFNALVRCGFSDSVSKAPRLATIYQQYPVTTADGALHVDFAALRHVGDKVVKAALELDGHEFHHHTKEQVDRDYRRDRELTRLGWIVVRFSGSHVWRDAGGCALEFAAIIIEAIDRLSEG